MKSVRGEKDKKFAVFLVGMGLAGACGPEACDRLLDKMEEVGGFQGQS